MSSYWCTDIEDVQFPSLIQYRLYSLDDLLSTNAPLFSKRGYCRRINLVTLNLEGISGMPCFDCLNDIV